MDHQVVLRKRSVLKKAQKKKIELYPSQMLLKKLKAGKHKN